MTDASTPHSVSDWCGTNDCIERGVEYVCDVCRLVEQLEAHRKALVALIGWSDGDNGDDFGTSEWANARALVTNPASRLADD